MTNASMDVLSTVSIENVVTSATLETELSLDSLASDLHGAEYNVEQFPGIIYRSNNPRGTVLIFRSGKLVCTGASDLDTAHDVYTAFLEKLDELGVEHGSPDMEVQNIVGTGDLQHLLNLNAIAIGLGLEQTEYEPEQFPGLVYRMDDPDVVVLLFGSGRTVVTGARDDDEIREAIRRVQSELDDLSLLNTPRTSEDDHADQPSPE